MADLLNQAPPVLVDPLPSTRPRGGATQTRVEELRSRLARYLRRLDIAIPGGILVLLLLLCFVGPYVLPLPNPEIGDITHTLALPFTHGHLLGTDNTGDDVLSRLIYGGRVSIEVGLCAVAIGACLGTVIGSVSAYKGGWVDVVVMRCLDVLLAFPALILALAIADILGASERNTIIAISFFTVPAYSRLARSETLRMRNRDYVIAARAMGTRTTKVLLGHVIPNVVAPILTLAPLQVGTAMLTEATLSFLGLGVPVPTPSWGNMINAGATYLQQDPWLVLIPSAMLFITIVSLNLAGNGIREVYTSETS